MAVQRAARVVARQFDEAFRDLGINNWQFSLLVAVGHSEPKAIGALAELLDIDQTTLSSNLKLLERREFLQVQRSNTDRRVKLVGLTKQGRDLVVEALPHWRKLNRKINTRMSDFRGENLHQELEKLASG
ncbi:MarR family winged helix-turn-helix transcriptional regulator [Thalassospira mesophila]|nr:MarR family transcriptional regulator [Thalassospira mesophila]